MMARKTTGTDYGQVIMWAAIVVNAPRWAGAFIAADTSQIPAWVDSFLQYLNLISGMGMGLIEVIGTAYLLDAWGRMKPKKTHNAKNIDQRWLILTGFVIGLFILMPLILAPYMVSRMNGQTMAVKSDDFFEYVWAVAAVLSPAFIIGGVAVARDGLVGTGKEKPVVKEKKERQVVAKSSGEMARSEAASNGELPGDWRQLTKQQRSKLAYATREEREEMFPDIAARTRRQWNERLDKIAAQNGTGIRPPSM